MIRFHDLLLGSIAVKEGLLSSKKLKESLDIQKETKPRKMLGSILVEKGFITKETLNELLGIQEEIIQKKSQEYQRNLQEFLFGRILIHKKFVPSEDVYDAIREQAELFSKGVQKRLGDILVEKGLLTEEQIKNVLEIQNKQTLYCEKCDRIFIAKWIKDEIYLCTKCKMRLTIPPETIIKNKDDYLNEAIEIKEEVVSKRAQTSQSDSFDELLAPSSDSFTKNSITDKEQYSSEEEDILEQLIIPPDYKPPKKTLITNYLRSIKKQIPIKTVIVGIIILAVSIPLYYIIYNNTGWRKYRKYYKSDPGKSGIEVNAPSLEDACLAIRTNDIEIQKRVKNPNYDDISRYEVKYNATKEPKIGICELTIKGKSSVKNVYFFYKKKNLWTHKHGKDYYTESEHPDRYDFFLVDKLSIAFKNPLFTPLITRTYAIDNISKDIDILLQKIKSKKDYLDVMDYLNKLSEIFMEDEYKTYVNFLSMVKKAPNYELVTTTAGGVTLHFIPFLQRNPILSVSIGRKLYDFEKLAGNSQSVEEYFMSPIQKYKQMISQKIKEIEKEEKEKEIAEYIKEIKNKLDVPDITKDNIAQLKKLLAKSEKEVTRYGFEEFTEELKTLRIAISDKERFIDFVNSVSTIEQNNNIDELITLLSKGSLLNLSDTYSQTKMIEIKNSITTKINSLITQKLNILQTQVNQNTISNNKFKEIMEELSRFSSDISTIVDNLHKLNIKGRNLQDIFQKIDGTKNVLKEKYKKQLINTTLKQLNYIESSLFNTNGDTLTEIASLLEEVGKINNVLQNNDINSKINFLLGMVDKSKFWAKNINSIETKYNDAIEYTNKVFQTAVKLSHPTIYCKKFYDKDCSSLSYLDKIRCEEIKKELIDKCIKNYNSTFVKFLQNWYKGKISPQIGKFENNFNQIPLKWNSPNLSDYSTKTCSKSTANSEIIGIYDLQSKDPYIVGNRIIDNIKSTQEEYDIMKDITNIEILFKLSEFQCVNNLIVPVVDKFYYLFIKDDNILCIARLDKEKKTIGVCNPKITTKTPDIKNTMSLKEIQIAVNKISRGLALLNDDNVNNK